MRKWNIIWQNPDDKMSVDSFTNRDFADDVSLLLSCLKLNSCTYTREIDARGWISRTRGELVEDKNLGQQGGWAIEYSSRTGGCISQGICLSFSLIHLTTQKNSWYCILHALDWVRSSEERNIWHKDVPCTSVVVVVTCLFFWTKLLNYRFF